MMGMLRCWTMWYSNYLWPMSVGNLSPGTNKLNFLFYLISFKCKLPHVGTKLHKAALHFRPACSAFRYILAWKTAGNWINNNFGGFFTSHVSLSLLVSSTWQFQLKRAASLLRWRSTKMPPTNTRTARGKLCWPLATFSMWGSSWLELTPHTWSSHSTNATPPLPETAMTSFGTSSLKEGKWPWQPCHWHCCL